MSLWWAPVIVLGAFGVFLVILWIESMLPRTVRSVAVYKLKRDKKAWCKNYGHELYDYYDYNTHFRGLKCAICDKKAYYKIGELK